MATVIYLTGNDQREERCTDAERVAVMRRIETAGHQVIGYVLSADDFRHTPRLLPDTCGQCPAWEHRRCMPKGAYTLPEHACDVPVPVLPTVSFSDLGARMAQSFCADQTYREYQLDRARRG